MLMALKEKSIFFQPAFVPESGGGAGQDHSGAGTPNGHGGFTRRRFTTASALG
jgi:hypothetical protein